MHAHVKCIFKSLWLRKYNLFI